MPLPAPERLRTVLLACAGTLGALGLGAEALHAWGLVPRALVAALSLSYERNLPTWYASALLLCCALALAALAAEAVRTGAPHPRHWRGLAAGFTLMSLDEAVGLHEHLGLLETGGVLYFSWVVPAAALLAVLAALYLPFVRALPARLRRQVLVAGALYVGGAVGMELPLGAWTEAHGDDNLGYALIDHVEEVLELTGAGLFLAALVEALRTRSLAPLSTEAARVAAGAR